MRVSVRSLTAAILTLTVLLGHPPRLVLATPVGPSAIRWQPCPEDEKTQCGTMRVPVDWTVPSGPQIELNLARSPATDPKSRIGALMVNPGGPGVSAVNMALDHEYFGAAVQRRFDIVGIDPRGVGRSAPILCDQDLVDERPDPLFDTEAAFTAAGDYNRRLAADCARRSGPVYDHADTVSVVRDMEAVRLALGEQRISFFGASYGTLIGQLYAERYPDRLRALVLDGVMDHSAGADAFLTQTTEAVQAAFDEFVAWCARDTDCALRGRDVKRIWAELIRRATSGELIDPYDPPSRLGVWDLLSAAFSAFYDPQWYSFAHYLKEAYEPAPAGRRALRHGTDLTPHSFPAVMCQDWSLPVGGFTGFRERLRALAVRAPQVRVSPLALTAVAGCLGIAAPPVNPQRPIPTATGPVLVVNSRFDPATAYVWAQQVARQFGPTARLFTYQGWGHVAYTHSACIQAAVDRYLADLTLPAVGASCPAIEPEPFGVG
ncbi:alpha/beta hydrolase [Actinoplanes derwentensis]|uniref:Pimeloyl-ACP methyl ester carboxylesterase n=1 Tax=Actinoplanes derwentensis TaxID=113562 RepID=A0A1H2D8Y5_9ACTN|nr:alpha/beta hydrolase [Actinoplanes derwentensis]GID81519.1 peptidase [Actinoplanes derwentensis]SDT79215.1 Pimeloyl-ACP methyl ester carboxylesterase [Actinoplanes derwentensis]